MRQLSMKKLCLPVFLGATLAGCGGSAFRTPAPSTPINPPSTNPPAAPLQPGVFVSTPANNSTVGAPVNYVAAATTACAKGVGSIGIYTAPGMLAYQVNGATLNTNLNLSPGTYNTTVQEWDNCGGSTSAPINIKVTSGGPGNPPPNPAPSGNVIADLQKGGGWTGYVLLPPSYNICPSCSLNGPQTTLWTQQGVGSPSLGGSSMHFSLGGATPYSDGLWNNHLIGDFSAHGLPDGNQKITPNTHSFTYDVYFYGDNIGASQALEFDINQFVNGKSFIWGHECRIAGGNEWDIWDNPAQKWHPTGVPCKPMDKAWNHLTIQVQRTSDDHLLFQSITLNGQTATLNYYESPTSTGWYGITVNYQMDGNGSQQPYSIWLDKFNFTYW